MLNLFQHLVQGFRNKFGMTLGRSDDSCSLDIHKNVDDRRGCCNADHNRFLKDFHHKEMAPVADCRAAVRGAAQRGRACACGLRERGEQPRRGNRQRRGQLRRRKRQLWGFQWKYY